MIYETLSLDAPIRQGDIFIGMPRVEMSLLKIPIITESGDQVEMTWEEAVRDGKPVTALLAVNPVAAIVISQDCDASRSPDITLCEIRPFREVERKSEQTSAPKKWVNIITQHARINQKWFYLPPDEGIGFSDKMGVDFHISLRVPREELESILKLRKGRLNDVATAHFRERLAEFFRRYPYDEWYPLDKVELEQYQKDYPEAVPFPWQST